jgi:hypothetical protein
MKNVNSKKIHIKIKKKNNKCFKNRNSQEQKLIPKNGKKLKLLHPSLKFWWQKLKADIVHEASIIQ